MCTRLFLTLAIATAVTGCRDERNPVAPGSPDAERSASAAPASPGERSEEALSEKFSRMIPGFGGWYYEGANLVVVVTDTATPGLLAKARAAAQPTLRARPAGARGRHTGTGEVILRKGRYDWAQLSGWRDRMTIPVLTLDGVRYTDLDEVRNRLVVGVERAATVASVRSKFAELGIPIQTMVIQPACEPDSLDCQDPCSMDPYQPGCQEDPCALDPNDPSCQGGGDYCSMNPSDPSCQDPCEADPMLPECQTPSENVTPAPDSEAAGCTKITAFCRPLRGGLLMYRTAGSSNVAYCTIGFVIQYPNNSTPYFMTNSHCTASQGSQTNTLFYQPAGASRTVGIENSDPPYLASNLSGSSTRCTSTNPCRFSDAASVRIEEGYFNGSVYNVTASVQSDLGLIARPTRAVQGPTATNAPLDINPNMPVLTIIGEYKANVPDVIHKIGGLTGWTYGAVTAVCVDRKQSSGKIHLCQTTVKYSSLEGDSGGPTFVLLGNNQVFLTGIHHSGLTQFSWSCFCNKRIGGVYSPLEKVRREMGGFRTYPGGQTSGPT